MGAASGFPIDLVLFAMIAAFLVLRLRSVLGRRQGFERPAAEPAPATQPSGRVIDLPVAPVASANLPDPAGPVGLALAAMRRADPAFDPERFLSGATNAFRIIVGAFAAGQRETLRPLLAEDTFRAFDSAISGRETAAETQRTEIRAIHATTIESAELQGSRADIGVRFVSDQVNVTMGANGLPVAGADAVTEITDLWSFERDLGSPDPTWRLAAARSA